MMNAQNDKFLAELEHLVNSAKLPACLVRVDLELILYQVRALEQAAIQKERQAAAEEDQKTEE